MAASRSESNGQAEGQVTDQNPIINDPFAEPTRHWEFGEGEPRVVEGRRLSGYLPAIKKGGQLQITDQVIQMEQVNRLRDRVRDWREDSYPGSTAITRDLFDHWFDPDRELKVFFAQREAIETLVFLTEASPDRLQGIQIPSFESYERWAVKLATGAGKTLVMAMTISWSGLNRIANRQDQRFADAFLVVCPNLTVKQRLSRHEGLLPASPDSAYRAFDLVPPNLSGPFGQISVMVTNWHALAPEQDPKRSVQRRGPEGDGAFCRRVLRDLPDRGRLMVLNDEAHHAWRPPPDLSLKGEEKKEAEQATVWIQGLERIARDRGVLRAIDFSATPMYPGVLREKAWTPFEWVVCDFALVDAIESGLVKVPRIPTDDNAGRSVPKYRNLWEHIKGRLPKRGDDPADTHPLTDYLSEVDGPLKQLSAAWERTLQSWQQAKRPVPPVLIVVCNETKMAELLEKHIAEYEEAGASFANRHPDDHNTVRIDSRLLDQAEIRDESESANDAAERIRRIVATVGKVGEPGEDVRCLISVSMLAEGWDARNVTQILGLRAFQSQLLCEQVVGRGLRRSDYSDLSQPEFVDVYGIPFQLLPFAKATGTAPIEPPELTTVRSLPDRAHLKVDFPRVVQIVSDIKDRLEADVESIEPIRVSAEFDPTTVYVEFEAGEPGHGLGGELQDREAAYARFRLQRLVFRLAALIVAPYEKPWLFPQAVKLVKEVIDQRVIFEEGVDPRELCNLRYLNLLQERIEAALRPSEGGEGLLPVLDQYQPIGSTEGVVFSTVKPCEATEKSHLSHAVCDSKLEAGIVRELERHPEVEAYAKNDRLFLEIPYQYLGKTCRYRPDFIVRLGSGEILLIEGKGRPDEKDDAKATAARRWIAAVNSWGKLGHWEHAICNARSEVPAIIERAGAAVPAS